MIYVHESVPRLMRLREVLQRLSISRSAWYAGIQRGIYPSPLKLGRTSVWSAAVIDALIERLVRSSAAHAGAGGKP
jgi:prophage regulatory protein